MIIIGGMIGLGKSSVAKVLGAHFKASVFYESVDDNPILPLFYTATEEEIESKRYAFLLQLYFLDAKTKSMKEAQKSEKAIIDRSIYEDWYFAKVNKDLGRISKLEFELYERLFNNFYKEQGQRKKDELMIYLKGSFETVLSRINQRGRSFEVDEHLKAYYKTLWEGYDELIMRHYSEDEMLIVDMDKVDIVHNEEDAKVLIQAVEEKLLQLKCNA